MMGKRYIFGGAAALALAVAIGGSLWTSQAQAWSKKPLGTPSFQVDPFWPKPLPDNWVTGEIGGTCVDSQDHVFVLTRGFQTGGLASPEGVAGRPDKSTASPPVIEFDPDGNVVNSWGNPALEPAGTIGPAGNSIAGQNAVLPNGTHGCWVDYQDNVWIAGNGDGVVQKYSHDGSTLLLQIGTKFLCDNSTSPAGPFTGGVCGNSGNEGFSKTLLNEPADIAVDPSNGEVYIADGYGNHRVVVFNKAGVYMRQMGGVGPGLGQFTAGDGGHPHCVHLGKDGLVYACDRGQDRINVYTKGSGTTAGIPVTEIPVIPGTAALGTAGSAWDVGFSPESRQIFMYVSDGGNEVMWTFNHAAALKGSPNALLDGFGRPGHMAGDFTFLHMMAVDSQGNLYVGETIGGRRVQKFTLQNCNHGLGKGKGNCRD